MPRAVLLLAALCAPAAAKTLARPPADAPGWSAAKAVGPPDAGAGDNPNAWATLAPDAGAEWLEVRFERSTKVGRVVVHENENPGAIARIVALDPEVGEVVLWQGEAPRQKPPARFEIKAAREARTDRIRIELDTSRVPGWNEIDAVELVGTDASRQWAIAATASSSYADAGASASPFSGLVGRPVRVRLAGGETLEGRLVTADASFLRLDGAGGRVYVVPVQAVSYVDGKP